LMEWLPYSTTVEIIADRLLEDFRTSFNYPNPFNSSTIIRYYLPAPASVSISIFNSLGQQVKKWHEMALSSGWHQAGWDGKNDQGIAVNTGIYFYHIQTENYTQNGRMILIR
jgi:hypothetical protein